MVAIDRFAKSQGPWPAEQLSDPVSSATAVTPSDSVDLVNVPKSIYVGVSGDITMMLQHDTVTTLWKSVPIGWRPVRPSRIWATGTTATNILAMN